jgi:hypothetical protein
VGLVMARPTPRAQPVAGSLVARELGRLLASPHFVQVFFFIAGLSVSLPKTWGGVGARAPQKVDRASPNEGLTR